MNEFTARKLLRVRLAGTEFTFRPASLLRMLAQNKISPAAYEALTARKEGVGVTNAELLQAYVADNLAFSQLLVCDMSVSPKIVADDPGPDSDAVWIELFTDNELNQLVEAIGAYNNCEPGDFQVIAPFRNVANDDDSRADVPDHTVPPGE